MKKRIKSLLTAAAAVVVAGLLSASCIVVVDSDDAAEVRYTWDSRPRVQGNIVSIAASYGDVRRWHDEIYMGYYYTEEDATNEPRYSGSNKIPNDIYTNERPSSYYNGRYLPISEGKYTAVCTAEDSYGHVDIVANYEIAVRGAYKYFEVSFDVAAALNDPDWYWDDRDDMDVYDNSYTGPMLSKSPVGKGLVKKFEKGGVTYHVFRRPKG